MFYGASFGSSFYDAGTFDFSGISTSAEAEEKAEIAPANKTPSLVTSGPIVPLQTPVISTTSDNPGNDQEIEVRSKPVHPWTLYASVLSMMLLSGITIYLLTMRRGVLREG